MQLPGQALCSVQQEVTERNWYTVAAEKGRMAPAAVSVSAFHAENMGDTAEVPPRMSCLPPTMIG